MKNLKFWLAGALFASFVTAMAVNINLKYGAIKDSSDFILTNVEALAQGEGGDNECYGNGSIVCGGATYFVKYS